MGGTVLVTGGTGFVAGWCVAGLLERGYVVRTTVRDLAAAASVRAAVTGAGLGAAGSPTFLESGATGGRETPLSKKVAARVDDRLSFAVADLTRDAGWDEAVAGCDYVLHVASPLGGPDPIGPARDGTLRVLRAAAAAGVKRVVLTSSTAAATPPETAPTARHASATDRAATDRASATDRAATRGNAVEAATPSVGQRVSDETVWTDERTSPDPYRLSKVVAERAAWQFMAAHPETELTTILPTAVLGPVRSAATRGSVDVVRRLLAGRPPVLPRFGFHVVDVRDLADLHIAAMTAPAAAGQRFIASGEFLWYADIARILRDHLGARARKVPTRRVPDTVVRALARLVPALRSLVPLLGRDLEFSSAKARTVLGFTSRPAEQTIVETATSL